MPDLFRIYNHAKEKVILAGFIDDITWQAARDLDKTSCTDFLCNLSHVILNSGMRGEIIDRVWPGVYNAFFEFDENSLRQIPLDYCFKAAFVHFKNEKKLKAIISGIQIVQSESWETIRYEIKMYGVDYLERFPFIGPITKYHLAKNIGFDVAKPDRHLERMARAAGSVSVHEFCRIISELTHEKVAVVDIVLWRWATIETNYLEKFA